MPGRHVGTNVARDLCHWEHQEEGQALACQRQYPFTMMNYVAQMLNRTTGGYMHAGALLSDSCVQCQFITHQAVDRKAGVQMEQQLPKLEQVLHHNSNQRIPMMLECKRGEIQTNPLSTLDAAMSDFPLPPVSLPTAYAACILQLIQIQPDQARQSRQSRLRNCSQVRQMGDTCTSHTCSTQDFGPPLPKANKLGRPISVT